MKLKIVSITALLLTIGTTPVRADMQCRDAARGCMEETNWLSDRRFDDYNDDEADINQIYREVLGRDADNEGLRTYIRKLDKGQSLRDIRDEIANSREARDVVSGIYRNMVGRSADRSAIKEYTRMLSRGRTLSDVRAEIVGSDRFRSRNFGNRPPISPPSVVPAPQAVPAIKPPMFPQTPGVPAGAPSIAPPLPVRPQ